MKRIIVVSLFAAAACTTTQQEVKVEKKTEAPPPPKEKTTQEYFTDGVAAFDAGNYDAAKAAFEQVAVRRASCVDGRLDIAVARDHDAHVNAPPCGLVEVFAFLVRRHEIAAGQPDASPRRAYRCFQRDEIQRHLIAG